MGGMVLETNMTEIMLRIEEQNKMEKEEVDFVLYLTRLFIHASFSPYFKRNLLSQ